MALRESPRKATGKPFVKGDKRAGRPKGTPNKFTTLKADFLEAYEKIGGVDELAEWARNNRNRKDFYRMIATMLPKHVEVSVEDHAQAIAEKIKEADPDLYEKLCEILESTD